MEHEERPLIGRQPPEPAFELVPVGQREHVVGSRRSFDREDPQVCRPPPLPRGVVDAFMDDEAMEPRIEPVRIAEPAQVAPGDHQRVLQGILGPVDIAEDSVGQREQPVRARVRIKATNAALSPRWADSTSSTVHVSVPLRVRRGRVSEDYGLSAARDVHSSARGRSLLHEREACCPRPSAKNAIHSSTPVSWTKMRRGSLVSSTPRLPSSA